MYKLIFDVITQPLGLPIHWIYEYIILLIVHEIVFKVAWNISPGGRFGSGIHWLIRIPTFIIIWFVLYVVIFIVKWIITNWILLVSILTAIVVLAIVAVFFIRKYRESNG